MGFRKAFGALALATLVCNVAASANATEYLFSYSGDGVSASGTITVADTVLSDPANCLDCATNGFLVTAMSGTHNGDTMTLLTPSAFAGNDNQIYPGASNDLFRVDSAGLAFQAGGVNFSLFDSAPFVDASMNGFTVVSGYECSAGLGCNNPTVGNSVAISGTLTQLGAVPEPASWALMLLGFGGLGVTLRTQHRARRCQPRIF